MNLATQLKDQVAKYHLLDHPFYQSWMKGELSLESLQNYAGQYYPHVKAFPRFVSSIHSHCEDPAARKFLLENLNDEEGKEHQSHPELWEQFAQGLGVDKSTLENMPIDSKAQDLVDIFWSLCRSSYEEGLGALYAYEYQVPAIAKLKIQGLVEFYGITDPKAHAFFKVHEEADVFHSATCADLLDALPEEKKVKALNAAEKAASALWDFLTEVHGEKCA